MKTILIAFVLLIVENAWAAEKAPMIFGLPFTMPVFRTLPPLEHCYEKYSDRKEARACLLALKDEAETALREITANVRARMAELDRHSGRTQALRSFDQAQRQFSTWRDANCRFYGAQSIMKSGEPDLITDCFIRMTQARRRELSAFGGGASAPTASESTGTPSTATSSPENAAPNAGNGDSTAAAFLNVDWRLREISEGTRRVSIPEGALITLRLSDNGRVSGNAGVNRYFGGYRVSTELTIAWTGGFATTRMDGPPELMSAERAYLDTLSRASIAQHEEKVLKLFDSTRELTLTFVRP